MHNTQLELSRSRLPLNTVLAKICNQLVLCRLYLGQKLWKSYIKQLDICISNPATTRLFFTDFGATINLSATEIDNSSVDSHAESKRVLYIKDVGTK